MKTLTEKDPHNDRPLAIRCTAELLGGKNVLGRLPKDALDVHDMLLQGLPFKALAHLIDNLSFIRKPVVLETVGMSLRTFELRRIPSLKPLNSEQSCHLWQFAELLCKATIVFGSQAEAEHWMGQPIMGLDQRCPINLLATTPGMKILEEFLGRLEYGVYA